MEIKGKVHLFFEQSGTFKNEFIKLGIPALDYDIQNSYGQTDCIVDLFNEIDIAYDKTRQDKTRQDKTRQDKTSVFDSIEPCQDLIIAFFPCIYFETIQQLDFALMRNGTLHRSLYDRIEYAIDRLHKRTSFHEWLYKLTAICDKGGYRLVIENPATKPNYLISGQNFLPPTIVDNNRMERGDWFRKPTAYWFINCEPTHGYSYQYNKAQKIITDCKRSNGDGLCGTERSLIHPDYARNWICDFILGIDQHLEPTLFD